MVLKLIIGLGNPGKKYAKTRHNLGARVVEAWHEQNHGAADVLLPQAGTYMNDFGTIVPKDRELLVVHDDIEVPLEQMRFTAGGSARGHKGVRSVQAALGTRDIPRLRLGVGRPPEGIEVEDYVLAEFTDEEMGVVEEMMREAMDYLTRLVHEPPSPS